MTTRSAVIALAIVSLCAGPLAAGAEEVSTITGSGPRPFSGLGPFWGGGPQNEFTIGSGWFAQNAPEAKFQEYGQVPQGAWLESLFWRDTTSAFQFDAYGENLFLKNQGAGLRLANGVRYRADFNYRQMPHLLSQIARSPFVQVAPGVFRLPDSVQAVVQRNPGTAYIPEASDLVLNSPGVPLGFNTDVAQGRLGVRPTRGLTLSLTGSRRERSGAQGMGASLGFNDPFELPVPVNQRMVDADLTGDFTRGPLVLRLSGGLSAFDNRINAIRWDALRRVTSISGGTAEGQIGAAPDNQVVRGNVVLGYRLPMRTAFTATVGLAHGTQDQKWLPLTVNSALPQSSLDSLPGRSTDAKSNQILQDYRLTSRLLDGVSGTVRFRQYRYDNKTPEHEFTWFVPFDQSPDSGLFVNEPVSSRQDVIGADADLFVIKGIGLTATYEHRIRHRTFREVEKDNEDAVLGRLRMQPFGAMELMLGAGYATRKLDKFIDEAYQDDGVFFEQPGLRRYDVANRNQVTADAQLSFPLGERMDFGIQYMLLQNKYPDSPLGVQIELNHEITADAGFRASDALQLHGGVGVGDLRSNQSARMSPTAALLLTDSLRWTMDLDQQELFAYAGTLWKPQPKLGVALDYEFGYTKGQYDIAGNFPTVADLPNSYWRRHQVSAEARYRLLGNTDLAARYGYDRWDFVDFQQDNVTLLGLTTSATGTISATGIYLGDRPLDYHAHRVSVLATRRF